MADAEKKLISPTELLQSTWKTFSSRPLGFIGVSLVPSLPLIIVAGVAAALAARSVMGNMTAYKTGMMPATMAMPNMPLILGIVVIFGILFVVCTLWQIAATIIFTAAVGKGTTMTVKEALKAGWQKKGAYLKTIVPGGLIAGAASLLLFIPGLIVNILFSVAPWIVAEEGLVGRPALLKSKVYVWGRGLAVFGRMLIGIVLLFIGIFGLTLLSIVPILGQLINIVAQVVIVPLAMIYSYHIYASLKATRPNPPVYTKNPWWVNVGIAIGCILGLIWLLTLVSGSIVAMLNPQAKVKQAQDLMNQPKIMLDTTSGAMEDTEESISGMPDYSSTSSMSYVFLNQLATSLEITESPTPTTFTWMDKSGNSEEVSGYTISGDQIPASALQKGLEMATFSQETTTGSMSYYQSTTIKIVCVVSDRSSSFTLSCADVK